MPRINDPENFGGRVIAASLVISTGGRASRSFDNCFENFDGDAVATALYRRAQKSPDGHLARNLWRYLSRDSVEEVALANAHRTNLSAWARELRAEAERQRAERWARAKAEQEGHHATFRTELTPAGEQTIIPGCESNASPKARQLDLFG